MFRRAALLIMTAAAACADQPPSEFPAAAGSFAPHLSRTGDRIIASWVERDASGIPMLRFASRTGPRWGPPQTAVRDARLAADSADIPAVALLADGSLAAYWTGKRDGEADARDVWAAVSKDGGASWTEPVRPHRDDSPTEHGMAALLPLATGGDFGVCWLDGRAGALSDYGQGGTGLYWAEWTGAGFGPEVLLDPRVCDCCKTSVARGVNGPVVAYRDRDDADRRDISLVRRDATAWSGPEPVRHDGWSLSACPTNGPAITAAGGRVAVAWFTGADEKPSVWATRSGEGATGAGPAVRIDGGAPVGRVDAAMLPDGSTAVVWLERKGGLAEIRVRRLGSDGNLMPPVVVGSTSPARASGYPSIAANGGHDVLIAWTETGPPGRVRASAVSLP